MENLLDFKMYTTGQLISLFIGTIFWLWYYVDLAYRGYKLKYVEMPIFVACGNIAWEFLWGFVFKTEMGLLLTYGYQVAFILDIFIFYFVLRYMGKWQEGVFFKRYFVPLCLFGMFSYGVLMYFFFIQGLDTNTGSTSAYLLNVGISFLYLVEIQREDEIFRKLSYTIAWCKILGNIGYTVFLFLYFPENYFVQTLGVLCFVFDVIYLVMFIQKRNQLKLVTS